MFESRVLNDMEEDRSAGVSKRVTLIIVAIAGFVSAFLMTSMTITLPTIGKEFAMEAVLLAWIVNATNLSTAALVLASGRLADIYGRKKILLYGTIVLIASSFLCASANSGIMLIACRALQGIAGGMTGGTSVAILTSVFPAEERGRAIGIHMGALYLGAAAGPFLGGVLTQQISWRSIFLLVGFLGLAVIALIFWRLKGEWTGARGERFDITGSLVFGISLVVLMYGFSVLLTPLGIALAVLGVLGMVVFVWWEARTDSPILNISLFRKNTVFVFSNLATLINYCAALAVIFLLTLYLQYTKGYPPQTAGTILLIQTVFMAIIAPIAGRLSDRIEPQIIAATAMALNCVVFLLFLFLTEDTSLAFILTGLGLFGIGWGLFSTPNTNAVMGSVDRKYFGVASATMGTMRSVGMILSIAIAMILFSIYIGDAEITPEYYPAFLQSAKVGFIVFATISFGGIFAQLAGRKSRQE